jgi:surfactin synthase thioesterase subunit
MDIEALERFAIQLLALAEQHTNQPLQRDLRRLAKELVDLIEASEQPEKARPLALLGRLLGHGRSLAQKDRPRVPGSRARGS